MMPNCSLAEAAGVELRDVDKALLMGEELGTAEQLARFQSMLARRAKREPLQYITGHAPFRYLDLKVGPGVFIPRPETETVVQAGLDWLTRNGMIHPRVVDLCAGSGAIGLSVVSEVPGSQVWAVELSPNTAEWTRRNLSETAKKYPSIASNYHLEIADATSFATLAPIGRHRRYRHHQSPTCRRPIFPSSRKCVIGIRNWLCMAARWTVR